MNTNFPFTFNLKGKVRVYFQSQRPEMRELRLQKITKGAGKIKLQGQMENTLAEENSKAR